MIVIEALGLLFILAGCFFFIAGTVGMLRFPDVYCRLHALTKADGLGLALTCIGVALLAASVGDALRIVLIWAFVALASATCGHLVARHARAQDQSGPAKGVDNA